MKNLVLGKSDSYKKTYDKSILTPISREEKRKKLNLTDVPMVGYDTWNSYECTFLNAGGVPQDFIGRLTYSSDSKYIIESKSLKLYLNSFDNKKMTKKEYEKIVKQDLSNVLETKVSFELLDLHHSDYRIVPDGWTSIRNINVYSNPDDVKLVQKKEKQILSKMYQFNCLRSLCPVTAQKDTGSVFISMISNSGFFPTEKSLIELIVSFRNHQEFHEQCIERMFQIIYYQCKPEFLEVRGNYVRRGGIDIVPYRATELDVDYSRFDKNVRMVRQ